MLLFNSFINGKYGGGAEDPVAASQNAAPAISGAIAQADGAGTEVQWSRSHLGRQGERSLYMDFFAGSLSPNNNLLRIRVATLDLALEEHNDNGGAG